MMKIFFCNFDSQRKFFFYYPYCTCISLTCSSSLDFANNYVRIFNRIAIKFQNNKHIQIICTIFSISDDIIRKHQTID